MRFHSPSTAAATPVSARSARTGCACADRPGRACADRPGCADDGGRAGRSCGRPDSRRSRSGCGTRGTRSRTPPSRPGAWPGGFRARSSGGLGGSGPASRSRPGSASRWRGAPSWRLALVWSLAVPALPCEAPGGDRCPPADDAIQLVSEDALAYAHAERRPRHRAIRGGRPGPRARSRDHEAGDRPDAVAAAGAERRPARLRARHRALVRRRGGAGDRARRRGPG